MRSSRFVLSLFALLAMLAVLAACGGKPVTFADIPLLPAAAPLQAGTHPFADTVSKTLRDSLGGKNVKLDMQLYGLPTETNWVDVKGFYETQIKGDWKTESRLAQDTPAFKLAGWSRGGFASEQGLVVGYGAGMLGNPPFLIVALFSE